ncbi:hypothetical protein QZH41_008978 [Actinostola sp. cb2023]|nr:hypothetical protein QZH41_008978 [Actinostola sp. cb2023]
MAYTSAGGKKRVCYYYDGDIGNYYYGQGHPMKTSPYSHDPQLTPQLWTVPEDGDLLNGHEIELMSQQQMFLLSVQRPHKAVLEEMTKYHSDDYVKFLKTIRPDNMSEYTKQMQRFNVGEDCPVFDGLYEFCQLATGGSLAGRGKYYAVNFPLRDGIEDDSYQQIFQPVSSLRHRLGCFNLSLKGHAQCVEYVKKFGLPLLILGGGGYTIRNVARCGTYETSVALDSDIANELPYNDLFLSILDQTLSYTSVF